MVPVQQRKRDDDEILKTDFFFEMAEAKLKKEQKKREKEFAKPCKLVVKKRIKMDKFRL